MYLKTSEIMSNGQLKLPDGALENLGLVTGDHVAFIYDQENQRIIMRKLTSGEGMMTYDEFLKYRDVEIKDADHEKIVKLFYSYLSSVTGNTRLLPDLIGELLGIDTSSLTIPSSCFNGIFDGTKAPYEDVDFYIRLSNDTHIFIYGSLPHEPLKDLNPSDYVVLVLSNDLNGSIDRKSYRHIYIT